MYRARWILGVVFWLAVVVGGGAILGRHDRSVEWIPQLRFAGVDTQYALRRVAGEAGLAIAIDDVRPPGVLGDLAFRRIDLDTRAGPMSAVLDQLRSEAGAFDYEIRPGLLYVRSNLPTDVETNLDVPLFAAETFEGNWDDLVRLIANTPRLNLRASLNRSLPELEKVTFDIPEGASVLDLLILYAQKMGVGWHLSRAGYVVAEKEGRKSVRTSTVRLWRSLDEPRPVPDNRHRTSMTQALASLSARTDTPICILDRSLMGDNRGSLDFLVFTDTGEPLEVYLEGVRERSGYVYFDWERDGNLVVLRSHELQRYPVKNSLLRQRLPGGEFAGTLGDLARLVNRNIESQAVLQAGEILPDDPVARFRIEEGSTVEEALLQFARESGSCFCYNSLDWLVEVVGKTTEQLPDFASVGGFVSLTRHWATRVDPSYY